MQYWHPVKRSACVLGVQLLKTSETIITCTHVFVFNSLLSKQDGNVSRLFQIVLEHWQFESIEVNGKYIFTLFFKFNSCINIISILFILPMNANAWVYERTRKYAHGKVLPFVNYYCLPDIHHLTKCSGLEIVR